MWYIVAFEWISKHMLPLCCIKKNKSIENHFRNNLFVFHWNTYVHYHVQPSSISVVTLLAAAKHTHMQAHT